MTAGTITADSFPTPNLALRHPAPPDRVRDFAHQQAAAAEQARADLATGMAGAEQRFDRLRELRAVHADLVQWRYDLARTAPGRLGDGLPMDAERFRMSLRDEDGGANFDRLGYVGRLRHQAVWDESTLTYQGGDSTPAHETLLTYGQAALDRFAVEAPGGDELVNVVRLPGRRGQVIRGNRLVRGAAGRAVAADLVSRVAARGVDASRMEIGGDPVYVVTADPEHADVMFDVALSVLADAVLLDHAERLRVWQDARYLLYQAPRTKKGSDAVTRVFLVAVGAVLLGVAPVLDHDVDLRCMVLGQDAATRLPADESLLTA